MSSGQIALTLGLAVVLGAGTPWLFVRMLVPALESSPGASAVNFRGRTVFHGLGIAWLVWAGAAIIGGVAGAALNHQSVLPVLTLAGPLALVAFALGVIDDAYGSSASRGFRGHLTALLSGRLTTGGLKLVGIGAACLVVALAVAQVAPWGPGDLGESESALHLIGALAVVVVAGASIALTSNFVNLTDLRPGRALKVYLVLSLAGVASTAAWLGGPDAPEALGVTGSQRLVDAAALAIFVLGPVLATWRYDLGERGMLGDAGANPMGAVAGILIVAGLPLWALMAFAALMLALNLVSERVSFSAVIDGNAALRRIDAIGRIPADDPSTAPPTTPDGPPVARTEAGTADDTSDR